MKLLITLFVLTLLALMFVASCRAEKIPFEENNMQMELARLQTKSVMYEENRFEIRNTVYHKPGTTYFVNPPEIIKDNKTGVEYLAYRNGLVKLEVVE